VQAADEGAEEEPTARSADLLLTVISIHVLGAMDRGRCDEASSRQREAADDDCREAGRRR